jgi:serpin B
MRLLLAGVISLVVSHGLAVVGAEGPPATKGARQTVQQAAPVTGDFAFDLYRQLAKANPGTNLFLSPYSVSSALTMAAEGARGQTAAEMGKVLGYPEAARQLGAEARLLPWNMAMIHQQMAKHHALFRSKPDSPYLISVANALYGEKTYPFAPSFIDTMATFYGSDVVRLVDFKNTAEASRQQMNAWVEQQTRERIKNLVPARAVKPSTRLVIINAIYFNGDWATPFDERSVREEDFHANSQKTTVPMMHAHKLKGGRYAAFNADGSLFVTPEHRSQGATKESLYPGRGGFQIAELPYKGGSLAMVLVVPQDVDGLTAIEKELTAARLRAWLGKLDERVMNVGLPKFGIESSYEMSDPLRELGMRQAMNPDDADFSGMSADGSRGFAISQVLHKAFVKVTEQGTEAAAATAVVGAPGRVSSEFIPAVRADRPFLFAICDRGTGTILFLGRLIAPADAALAEGGS